jgi:Helicase associated domain
MAQQSAGVEEGEELSPDRVKRLEQVGIVWEPQDALWEQRFKELEAFKAREGKIDVPQHYPENQRLATWLSNQRQFKRRGALSQDRIDRLEALGVEWRRPSPSR